VVDGAVGQAVWINGERRDPAAPHVSSHDRGLTLGDGVFETMRVWNGQVFRLERHLARLAEALVVLRIPAPPDLRASVLRAVEDAGLEQGSVRLTVTRGAGPAGVAAPEDLVPTVIAAVGPMPVFASSIHESGLRAHVASGRRNERAMTAGLKTLAYVDAVVGLIEARRAGGDEALFLDTDDHLSEATASNLFVWTGEALLTPPLSCGALPGITRATVLELAGGLGLETFDRAFGMDVLADAREAFLTSSLRGIAPLVSVDGTAIDRGTPGAITRRIADAYASLVDRECC
jgi:branched-chain amino acid aminotransferase